MKDQINTSWVYVVCGRNTDECEKMYRFLEALGLQPITKEIATRWTGESSPYSDRIIDEVFKRVQAIIVLLTGDDVGRLRPQLHKENEPRHEKELTPQPRPDQLFEAGFAFGRSAKYTILLRVNNQVRPFSDIDGRYIADFSWRRGTDVQNLVVRLKNAGCTLNLDENAWRNVPLPVELYTDVDQLLERGVNASSVATNTMHKGRENESDALIQPNPHEVFVICGRNKNIINFIYAFLSVIGLTGIRWHRATLQTLSASPYIGEILDVMMQRAQAVIVLLTGDDEAALRGDLLTEEDAEDAGQLLPQPRPNVLFEAGMVFSDKRLAPNTILVEACKVRICQSLAGRNRINLTNSLEDRKAIAYSLRYRGCAVKIPSDRELREFGSLRC